MGGWRAKIYCPSGAAGGSIQVHQHHRSMCTNHFSCSISLAIMQYFSQWYILYFFCSYSVFLSRNIKTVAQRGFDSGPPSSQVTVLSYLVAAQKLVVKAHSFHTGHKGWLLRGGPPPISEYLQNKISTIAPQYFDLGLILFNLVDKWKYLFICLICKAIFANYLR